MNFSERLRELREEKKETQKEVAEQLGAKISNYNKWENGVSPSYNQLAGIAAYFEVSLDYLIGLSDYRWPKSESIERLVSNLPQAKQDAIFLVFRQLASCADAYEGHAVLEESGFFERLIADVGTYIEAYKNLPRDLDRYDELTTIKRFLDKIVHTNAPDIMYHISRQRLLQERDGQITREGESIDGEHC